MSDKIIFREKNEKLFWRYWEKLNKQASYRYLSLSLDAYLTISKNRSLLYGDKSFIYYKDDKPLAGVFLPIEKNGKYFAMSIKNNYVNAPLFIDYSVEKEVFNIIDDIAKDNNVSKIMFVVDPLENRAYNYLQKYNYLDTSILVYIINLEEDLFNSCRRNHRRNIKKILNNNDFLIFYMDAKNPSYKIHEEYRELHHKCSGRVTRDKKSFDLQFEKLKQGNATLFGLKYKNKNIAYIYFEYSADKAISASAADDPDYSKFPLYHILMFSAMEYLKKKGIKYIDTGNPSSPSPQINYYPDEKQLNIAHFKRGFGGDYKNQFRGIKYFSKDLFKEDMEGFIKNYSETIIDR